MAINVTHLDHLVLTVANIDVTCGFYERVMGMKRAMFGAGRVALHFGNQKINLHAADNLPDPNVKHPTRGLRTYVSSRPRRSAMWWRISKRVVYG